MRSRLVLSLGLAFTTLACKAPDRRAGLYIEHPGAWGADLVAIHHATFSDIRPNIRIRTEALHAADLLVANLEYPTSGPRNLELDSLLDEHAEFVVRYLDELPDAHVTFVGFSQGGCAELDLLVRIAAREPQLLERASMLLVAPARNVKLGGSTAVARRMIERCTKAEATLETLITADPDGTIKHMLGERTWLSWSCNDPIVGHDSFTTLTAHLPPEHIVYRKRLGHIPWAAKVHRGQADAEGVYLATAMTQALAQGRDLHEALADYVQFDASCE